ncbi:MAG TPA: glycosyltransferase family 39 protein, partial [Vicinamibacteria bacterium]
MTSLEKTAVLLACGAAFSWGAAHLGERALSGTVLRVELRTPSGAAPSVVTRASRISSDALLFTPDVGRGPARATFEGFLWMERDGPIELRLRGNTPGRVWLEETLVLPSSTPEAADRATVTLKAGLHRLRAELDTDRKLPVFRLTAAARSDDADDGAEAMLFPAPPGLVRRIAVRDIVPSLHFLARLLGLATAALGLWLVLGWQGTDATLRSDGGGGARTPARVWICALAVVAYAGLLRVESVVRQHWGLEAPSWARCGAALATELRPASLRQLPAERPYFGDPANYLRFAREMEHFYDAHVREPLFVAATRVGLRFTGNADVGISLTSALFSTLLVGATFVMGAYAFGPGVGLVAALLLAVERDVIGLSSEGWRDDTFAFWVVAFAASLLALLARPTFGRALLVGLAGGGAGLTRITALSFLLCAFAWAWWAERREPQTVRRLALAALIAAVLVAPFLATSRIAFGDALHSINAHTNFYRSRASLPAEAPMSWADYLARSFAPAELVRNLAVGLTVHPFDNKWGPFALWARPAPRLLRLLSLAGLALFLWSRKGRLLLVILLAALVPFAFTFRITGGNEGRFTL